MEYDKQTPKKEITIKGALLKVISPFKEGDVLTAATANVLNQTLAENLRNNFAPVVKQAVEVAGSVEALDLKDLQTQLNAYTKEYEFGARRTAGIAINPIERIAISLAREAVKKSLVKSGKNPKDYTTEQLHDLAVNAVGKYPHFTANAEKIHAARKEAAGDSLIEIAA